MFTSNLFEFSDAGFPWFAGAMLAFESCEVIRLRMAKLAVGNDDGEARLIGRERIRQTALIELHAANLFIGCCELMLPAGIVGFGRRQPVNPCRA